MKINESAVTIKEEEKKSLMDGDERKSKKKRQAQFGIVSKRVRVE